MSESKHQRETNQPAKCGWKQWGLNFGEIDWQERILNQQKLFWNRHKRWQAVEMVAVTVGVFFVPLILLCLWTSMAFSGWLCFSIYYLSWVSLIEILGRKHFGMYAKLSWHFQTLQEWKKSVFYFVCLCRPFGKYILIHAMGPLWCHKENQ